MFTTFPFTDVNALALRNLVPRRLEHNILSQTSCPKNGVTDGLVTGVKSPDVRGRDRFNDVKTSVQKRMVTGTRPSSPKPRRSGFELQKRSEIINPLSGRLFSS